MSLTSNQIEGHLHFPHPPKTIKHSRRSHTAKLSSIINRWYSNSRFAGFEGTGGPQIVLILGRMGTAIFEKLHYLWGSLGS